MITRKTGWGNSSFGRREKPWIRECYKEKKNWDQGLNVKRGTGPLQGNTMKEDEKSSRNENQLDLGGHSQVQVQYKMKGTRRVKVEQVLLTILTPWGNRMV